MKKNEKGFTLVELLIAVAIFSIVFAVASSVMIFTSKSFVKANADADVQREAQLVVDQIGDMIIDSTGDVDFLTDSAQNQLILYNQQPDGNYVKECVKWTQGDKTVKYSKFKAEYDPVYKVFKVVGSAIADDELLAEGITNFNVDLSDVRREVDEEGREKNVVKSVKVSMGYEDGQGKVSYATTPIITLRNRMLMIGSEKDVEPPVQYELSVRVVLTNVSEIVNPDKKRLMKLRCSGTVIQAGFEEGDLSYEWSVDKPFVTLDSTYLHNPKECYFYITEADRNAHLEEVVTMTLTVTPPAEKHRPVKGSDTYMVSKYGGEERGEEDNRHDVFIPNYDPNHITPEVPVGYDMVTKIYDQNGDIAYNQDDLIKNKLLWIEILAPSKQDKNQVNYQTGEFQNFSLHKSAYLDYTQSYIVEANYKVRINPAPQSPNDPVRSHRFYVPATKIISVNPVIKWYDNGFKETYEPGATGDGFQYRVDGFLKEKWVELNPYTVEIVAHEWHWKPETPEEIKNTINLDDYKPVMLNKCPHSVVKGAAARDNLFYMPLKMDVFDIKNNKTIKSGKIFDNINNNIMMDSVTIRMTVVPEKLMKPGVADGGVDPGDRPKMHQDLKIRFEKYVR